MYVLKAWRVYFNLKVESSRWFWLGRSPRRKIDLIYVACCASDFWQTRICIASIRYWYPDIPIMLIKDHGHGEFDTSEIERIWNVGVFPLKRKVIGYFGQLETYFLPPGQRFLVIDSDIVFMGRFLERLEHFNEDFVVSPIVCRNAFATWMKASYFDLGKLLEFDPNFSFPGFVFNTGQIVGTTGLFRRKEFDKLVEWGSPPHKKHPEIFGGNNQGVINYLMMRKWQNEEITLKPLFYRAWPYKKQYQKADLDQLKSGVGYPYLMHWCGSRWKSTDDFVRGDIMAFFKEYEKSCLQKFRTRSETLTEMANGN